MNHILLPWLSCLVHVLCLQFIAVIPFGQTNMQTQIWVSWWCAIFIFIPIQLQCRQRWREQVRSLWTFSLHSEAHWSSWLHYLSTIMLLLQSMSQWENTVSVLKHLQFKHEVGRCGRAEVGKAALFNHPESHISCTRADEAEQADSPEARQLPLQRTLHH